MDSDVHLFAVGALSPRACNSLIELYSSEYSSTPCSLLSEHLGVRARQMPWRSFAIGSSISTSTFSTPQLVPKRRHPVIFCFSGQGPQHAAMGKELFLRFPAFRDSILASDDIHKAYTGKSFIAETGLFSSTHTTSSELQTQIWPALTISVGITMFQMALTDLLRSLGIQPDVILGHSIGETAAFYASRAMPREVRISLLVWFLLAKKL